MIRGWVSVPAALLLLRRMEAFPGVYAIYEGRQLAYIGRSTNVIQRLLEHPYLAGVRGVRTIKACRIDDERCRKWLEERLIRRLQPPLNIGKTRRVANGHAGSSELWQRFETAAQGWARGGVSRVSLSPLAWFRFERALAWRYMVAREEMPMLEPGFCWNLLGVQIQPRGFLKG